jgi:hypothetical protein
MARYSKRRRSRRGSRRKRRGGDGPISSFTKQAEQTIGEGAHGIVDTASSGLSSTIHAATGVTQGAAAAAKDAADAAKKAAKGTVAGVGNFASSMAPKTGGGKSRGGSGRCCFPAKFCGSRKRKGNKRRSIRSGRCCLPVKSKKCGARKKNGRKTKKNKRKRGKFNMFGGG